MSYLENIFENFAKQKKIKLVKEYKFHSTRKWRFDFADEKNKIAIEIEGGVWNRGRHTRGQGYRNDTIKYNQATALGWRVLRYCNEDDIAEYFLEDYKKLLTI